MKPILLLSPLLLVACAPRAILLLDAGAMPQQTDAPRSVASNPRSAPVSTPRWENRDDDIGLMEPSTLTQMPDEREMRPTVDPEEKPAVIATPPSSEE